jgi:hypothetical protein
VVNDGDKPVVEEACCRWVMLGALGENFGETALRAAAKGLRSRAHSVAGTTFENRIRLL